VISYVLLVAALIVFFVILHYVEYIDDFMDRGATQREVFLSYYPAYIPEIVRLISPLALFMSVIILNGKLAQQLQLAALQTSGVSLYRLLVPYLFVAVAITGTMFWFNGWVVPETNKIVLDFEQKYRRDGQAVVDVNDIHRQTSPGSYVTVGYFDKEANIGHRASLLQFDKSNTLLNRIDASRMEWIDSLGVWRFRNVTQRVFRDGGEIIATSLALDTTLSVMPRDFARTERDVESMTIEQAAEYVQSLRSSGAGNLGKTTVLYYSKFTYPFANLILMILGFTLASVRRRGGQAIQIGLGLSLAFLYLTMMKVLEPFGYRDTLPPILAASLPHLVVLAGSLLYLLRVRK
jgi:lipopolysaccharide export system permease protein